MDSKEKMDLKYKEIQELKSSIESLERDKKVLELNIQRTRLEYDRIDDNIEDAINTAKNNLLAESIEKIREPYIDEIQKLEEKSNSLEELLETKKKQYTKKEFEEPYEDEISIINECIDNVHLAEECAKEHLGDRLTNVLNSRLNVGKLELGVDDLNIISKKLHKYRNNLKYLSRTGKTKSIIKKLNTLLEKLTPCKDETQEGAIKNDLIMYTIAMGGMSFLVIKYLSTFLLIGLFGICSYNIYKTYVVYRLLLESKLVQDNTDILRSMIDKNVEDQINSYLAELDKAYLNSSNEIANKITGLNNSMNTEVANFKTSFEFDSSDIENTFKDNKHRLEDERNSSEQRLKDLNNDLDDLYSQLNLAEMAYQELAKSMIDIYLDMDKCGESVELPNKILLDIDNNNNGIFWDIPRVPCLILYKDREEVSNFCKLLIVQLLNQMSPISIQINYIDGQRLGADMSDLFDMPENIFRITNPVDINGILNDKIDNLQSRLKSLGSNSIVEYNKEMIKNDSVLLTYNLLMFIDVDFNILKSQNMTSLLLSGSKVGILPYIFINEDDFLADKSFREHILKILVNAIENNPKVIHLIDENGDLVNKPIIYYKEYDE